ncbi:TonB-dependent receptor [Herbaspirillum sp. GCM10030257]|uniref:TonB-dependent receptor n=1 Tax=Herbaspirillum sp. GCM10030257 TaxID=3273393 RepID=UPI003618C020
MHVQRTLLARAVLAALAGVTTASYAQQEQTLPEVIVTATPFNAPETAQILAPVRVLSGNELRNKLEGSLGDTLSHELGVSTSSFGAGSSRPIIRGLGGPRVRIMENGMGVSDISTISEDHAVGTESATARQIEILRGPAALLYGSGAIGGLVNVVNERIPTRLEERPTGEVEARYGTADNSKALSFSVDGSAGQIGLHVDGGIRDASDYKIPGFAVLGDPTSASGRLPNSYARQNSLGFGASHVGTWGHIGASVSAFNSRYGIPTEEGAQIHLEQMRYDIDALVKEPLSGFDTFRVKFGNTDYKHTEFDLEGIAETNFSNDAFDSRWELTHKPIAGWRGTFGFQTENSDFSALSADGGPNTVPATKSRSFAGFLVEEKEFGPVRMNAGLRLEKVKREPDTGQDRSFNLSSYSIGGLWTFAPGFEFGPTFSIAQRAPSTEELYSSGPHHATETLDRGNALLNKETSRNLELTLQKTSGLVRWKANIFQNRVKNFVYGQITGNLFDDEGNPGDEFSERIYSQADATIRGAEAELSYNARGQGLSGRVFADTSHGRLDGAGNLPLQPATRIGVDVGHRQGAWRSGATLVRAQRQDRLASFETTPTAGYTLLDANLSYTQRYGANQVTWFAIARNLLNEEIRLSTSLLKDVAPRPGRSLVLGVRTQF